MNEPKDTKLVMFHCPEDVRAEMDALCELNMIDRTGFLLQSIYKMMDYLDGQQKKADKAAARAYPEAEEAVLMAADSSEDGQ